MVGDTGLIRRCLAFALVILGWSVEVSTSFLVEVPSRIGSPGLTIRGIYQMVIQQFRPLSDSAALPV
jgi:hypothetical protein